MMYHSGPKWWSNQPTNQPTDDANHRASSVAKDLLDKPSCNDSKTIMCMNACHFGKHLKCLIMLATDGTVRSVSMLH